MGNFLDTPMTEKETLVEEEPAKNLAYGASAMQGWRASMEDDHIHYLSLPELPELSLFGVYDGHGGDMVAHYMASHFKDHLLATNLLAPGMAEETFSSVSQRAFETSLMSIDDELRHLDDVESGKDQSGSTSVMTLLSPGHIVCANTGDSRAVLSRSGVAIPLSYDHKPYNPGEKDRIEAAGGHVKFNRVNGDLAVSRAVGDFVYKRCESVPAEQQAVTAFPEIVAHAREPEKDEFIVLACDGIWDVMDNQQVVDKVHDLLRDGRPEPEPIPANASADDEEPAPPPQAEERPWDLGAVCECLIDCCLHKGSRDNMSVIIVIMQPSLMPRPEAPVQH